MESQSTRRLHWTRLAGLTLLAMAFGMAANTLEPALLGFKILELDPENKNTRLGLITSAGLLVAVVVQPLVGALSDRALGSKRSRLPFLVVGSTLAVAFLYAVALAPSLAWLALAVLAYQAGSNTAQGPWQALLPDHVPEDQRGAASGLKSLFEILAFVLGRRLSGYMLARGEALLAVGASGLTYALSLALTAVAALPLRPKRGEGASGAAARPSLRGTAADLRSWSRTGFIWWFLNRLLFWAGAIAINTFILFYLTDVIRMPLAEASRFFADLSLVLGLGVLLMALAAGPLADRIGRRPIVIAAGLLAAGGTGLLLVVRDRAALFAVGGIVGGAVGMWLSASWALLTDLVPRAQAARYLGIANIATAGGSLVSRFAGAMIIDPINRAAQSQALGYQSLYAATAMAFLAATWAVLRIQPQFAPVTGGESRRTPD